MSIPQLRAELGELFLPESPEATFAFQLFEDIQRELSTGDPAVAKTKTWDLVQFIITQNKAGSVVAGQATVIRVINDLFCFAGIDVTISVLDNSFVVLPTDNAQVLVTDDALAGTALPPAVVSEPTLITIIRIDETQFPTGAGPLSTKLDQYPLFYDFTQQNEGNTGFNQSVVVGICPTTGIDPAVLARLRLGHDAAGGFEITPAATVAFLDCTNAPPLPTSSALRFVRHATELAASLLLPQDLHAFAGGGIGGSASEFSPFAPVDPRVTAAGGVGGSASEFAPPVNPNPAVSCPPVQAPIGTPVDVACRPEILVQTNLGTLLTGVPVAYTILLGGGTVAPENGPTCGTFGTIVSVPTGSDGKARACWTMGLTPGTNTVEGRPGIGGDAVPGVIFSPKAFEFTATANPPVQLAFLTQPLGATAGFPLIPTPVVLVQDLNGVTVEGSAATITMSLTTGSFTPGSTTVLNAANGVVGFPNLITTLAGMPQLVASSPGLASATSAAFTVTPDVPSQLIKLAGDNQTVPAGTLVPIAPSVKLADQYGNGIDGQGITFVAQNNAADVVGGAQTTAGGGVATVGSWKPIEGTNFLLASLNANPLIFTVFTATGTSALATLNACAQGGSGDPLSYPFWVPGDSRKIKEVELYLSSNGAANVPKTYQVKLTANLDSFAGALLGVATVNVTLTGRTSQFLPTQFQFPTVLASGSTHKVAFTFQILSNPDGATLTYNTGPCGLGSGCKPPTGCKVTQVGGTTPLPLGTLRRKSVGIKILGS